MRRMAANHVLTPPMFERQRARPHKERRLVCVALCCDLAWHGTIGLRMARTADDPGSAEIFSFPNSQEGTTASTATGSLDRCPCLHESPQRECSVRRMAAIMLCRMPSPRISATDSAGWANLPTTPSPDAAIAPQLPSPGSTCSWSLTRAACRDRPTTHGSMDLVSSRTRHIARSAPSPVMSSKPALAWFDTPLVTDSKGMHKPAHGTSLNGRLDLIRHALGH